MILREWMKTHGRMVSQFCDFLALIRNIEKIGTFEDRGKNGFPRKSNVFLHKFQAIRFRVRVQTRDWVDDWL